jgi:hypothetical protein
MNRINQNLNKLADIIVAMPVPPPDQPARTVRDAWGTSSAAPPAAPPATPASPALAHFAMEILDVAAQRARDPILPPQPIVRLDAAWPEAVTVTREGRDLFRLVQTDPDQSALDLSHDVYTDIVDALGDDAMPEPRADFIAEGEAWARAALTDLPHGDLAGWRGEPRARMEMVASRLARSYCLPPGEVERIVGIAPPPRGLYPVSQDYDRLAELRRVAEERKRAAAEAAARVQVEIVRDRTFAELGVCVVAVKIGRLADGLVPARASAPSHRWRAAEAWPGARVVFTTDDEVFYGFRAVPGVSMPRFERDGVRSVDASGIAPASMGEVVEADGAAMQFMADRKREAGEDFGAVRRLRAEVYPATAAFIAKHAPLLLNPSLGYPHRLTLFAEQVVRIADHALRPDAALRAIGPVLDARFRALHPPIEVPAGAIVRNLMTGEVAERPKRELPRFVDDELPSKSAVQWLGAALVRATQRGDFVPAGATLEPTPWPSLDAPMETEKAPEESTTPKKRTTK